MGGITAPPEPGLGRGRGPVAAVAPEAGGEGDRDEQGDGGDERRQNVHGGNLRRTVRRPRTPRRRRTSLGPRRPAVDPYKYPIGGQAGTQSRARGGALVRPPSQPPSRPSPTACQTAAARATGRGSAAPSPWACRRGGASPLRRPSPSCRSSPARLGAGIAPRCRTAVRDGCALRPGDTPPSLSLRPRWPTGVAPCPGAKARPLPFLAPDPGRRPARAKPDADRRRRRLRLPGRSLPRARVAVPRAAPSTGRRGGPRAPARYSALGRP